MLTLQTATGSPILQAALLDPDGLALGRVRAVVAGREADIPRGMAMALLLASDFPNKHRDFQEVLEKPADRRDIEQDALHADDAEKVYTDEDQEKGMMR